MKHLIFLLAVLFPLTLFGQSVSRTELRATNTAMRSIVDSATNQSYAYTRSQQVLSNSLFIRGPASATDSAIALFDATTGKLLKNSGVSISAGNNVTGVQALSVDTFNITGAIAQDQGTGSAVLGDTTTTTLTASNITATTLAGTGNHLHYANNGVISRTNITGGAGSTNAITNASAANVSGAVPRLTDRVTAVNSGVVIDASTNVTGIQSLTAIGGINAASTPPQFVVDGTTGGVNIGGGEAVLTPGSLVLNLAGPPGVTIINSDISPTDPQFSITQSGAFSLLTNKGPIYGSAFIGSGSGVGKLTLADEDGTLISQFYTNSTFGVTNIYEYSANILAGDCWKIKSTNLWQIFWTNGPCGSGGGSVAGNSGAIQFNESGAFAGTNVFRFDRTNAIVHVLGSVQIAGNVTATNTATASNFVATAGGTNVFGDTLFTNSISARTNIAPVDVSTNTINSGQKYTQGTRRAFIAASVQLTAAVAGTAIMTLYSETVGSATNKVTVAAGPLTGLVTIEQLSLIIGPGSVYYFTNESSGAGASTAIVFGTHNKIEL